MKIGQLWQKLFVGGIWMVGFRLLDASQKNLYARVKTPEGQWIADPFLYEADGVHYLFVEQYIESEKKASIGYYEFVQDEPVFRGTIIRQPYHLSYPCVFLYAGNHYLIPESAAGNTVELYRATHFPDQWEKVCNLIEGRKCVDSTVYQDGGKTWLLTYEKSDGGWELIQYRLDIEAGQLCEVSRKTYAENIARPAGHLYQENGLMRPAQDCSRKYGEAMILYEVAKLDESGFDERQIGRIEAEEIDFPEKVQRIHTLNRDSRYEVVDLFREKLEPLHGLRIFLRAHAHGKK